MRAFAVAELPGTPAVSELNKPEPEPGELLVRVTASSVNGFDLWVLAGRLQGMMEHRYPLVLGRDFAGTVEAVGAGVADFAVGDSVFGVVNKAYLGTGSLAQYVSVPVATGVARLPEGVSVRDAGALGLTGAAAFDAFAALGPVGGKTVLVSGATGGVGALAVQLAAGRGANVIATAKPGPEADFLAGLTSEKIAFVDYTGDVTAQVRALAPDGVDAVLHLAGDLDELTALVRDGGTVASLLAPPQVPEGRKLRTAMVMADPTGATLSAVAAQVASGALVVPVTSVYPLEQGADAFAAFTAGALGKIAVSVG
jgi:NADPH:quinone reductase-like Zn-dependent oxidoreductase